MGLSVSPHDQSWYFHTIEWTLRTSQVMENQALKAFGKRVRALRKARGWTQEDLAETAGLHENYISRLETGAQEPGFFVLRRLARAFNLSAGVLLDEATGQQ
jgi:ribosome-binding protein aMBF1 (putative translation factor)